MQIVGFILEDLGNTKTNVTYISDIDLMGDIPEMIKKGLTEEEGKVVSYIEEGMKKYYQN